MSTSIPLWLTQAREASYQRTVFLELSKREKERATHRNSSVVSPTTTSALRRLLPGKSTSSQSVSSDLSKHYSVAIGRDPENQWGNRYSNIEPYDRTRVVVGDCGEGKGRYFNGSWVRELHGQQWWIATQAPLRDTAHAFLSVLSQPIRGPSQDPSFPQGSLVRTVVQLTLNVENGRIKAFPYFPFTVGETMTITPESGANAKPYVVTLQEQSLIDEENCVESKLCCVSQGGNPTESFTFTHLLYTAWPDHGVPEEANQASLLAFLRRVAKVHKRLHETASDQPDSPIMVHCSAGVGRTGTFIALSSILRFYNLIDSSSPTPTDPPGPAPISSSLLGPLSPLDPVAQEIDSLREQRPEMVQRAEQATLVYQILEQAFSSK